jgi:2-desacetyl-2-hydroxyethyl bacteriochlorophyllide A dehydrogenase
MKALVYEGPEKLALRDFPDPEVKAGEVLLEVATAGICGSDIHGFLGHSERRLPGLVLGHETVARIADLDKEVTGWRKGQRVAFNPLVSCGACPACLSGRQNVCARWRLFGLDRLHGTYAEYVSVPACQLHALSEGLPEKEAILVEPLAVVLRAFRLALTEVPPSIVIIGAGPIGALALVVARQRGVPRVAVTDVSPERLAAAKALGADLALDASRPDAFEALRSFTDGGAECVIEAVGTEATRRAAVRATARGGRIVFLGIAANESSLPWIEMVRNEQAIFTSFAYAPKDFEASVRMVEGRRFDLKPWTESRRLEDGQDAFLTMAHRPGAILKMMLEVKA